MNYPATFFDKIVEICQAVEAGQRSIEIGLLYKNSIVLNAAEPQPLNKFSIVLFQNARCNTVW